MKLVHIITRSDLVGGGSIHVRDLSLGLLRDHHDVTVLVGGEGPFTDELRKSGIPYVSLKYLQRQIHPWRDCAALNELLRTLRNLKPDLVATHTAKAGVLGRIAAAVLRLPAVYTAHGWAISDRISKRFGIVFCVAERLVGGMTDKIINVCESDKRLAVAKKVGTQDNLVVVYNGIPDTPERADASVQPPRIIMVARFEGQKDHETLFRALAGMRDQLWELELVGTGSEEKSLREMAAALELGSRVIFSGACNDVAQRLAAAQLFVLTTKFEGFPLSVLEAMRAGLPVVATAVNGIPEQVRHGETGLLVGNGDEHEVRKALRLLIGDPKLRVRLGSAGRRLYETSFSFERMLGNTLAIYEQVLRKPRSQSVAKAA